MPNYYLFPFERVEKGSDVVLFGAGRVGDEYIKQLDATGYCNSVSFVDNKATNETVKYDAVRAAGISLLDELRNLTFDYIVISVAADSAAADIRLDLFEMGVPDSKIIHKVHCVDIEKAVFRNTPDPHNSNFWDVYYLDAEQYMQGQYDKVLKPALERNPDVDFTRTLDFACGYGRVAELFAERAGRLTLCDVNAPAI